MPGFIHLHVHSSYSLLEGALTIARLCELAKADRQPALALTDTDNMFGALEFSDKMAAAGIQPIVGCALAIDFADHEALPHAGSAARLVRGYLFRTAKHLAIDRLRHQAVQRAALQRELPDRPAEASDPAEQLAAREHAQDLLGFLQELSPKCRRVLELHRLEGLSQQEVGARLSLSDRMVRRYLTHAMVYCRLRLDGLSANEASRRTPL